tara:strand:- start:251 stop:637 length:387 start_codon:yes stop_codon:yes gene_type:complete
MNTLKTIYNKLSQEDKKVELTSEKIELSVAGDIQKALKSSNTIVKKLESSDKKMNKLFRAYEDGWEQNQVLIKDAKSKVANLVPLFREINNLAKELGIKANTVQGYKELEARQDELTRLAVSSYMTPL